MSVSQYVELLIILIPAILVIYFIKLLTFSVKKESSTTWKQMRSFFDNQKGLAFEMYKNNDMHDEFEDAGLIKAGITPTRYRIIRDSTLIYLMLFIHFKFVLTGAQNYPRNSVLIILLIYVIIVGFNKSFLNIGLKLYKKNFDRKKNNEIFILQQIISNEYSDKHSSRQNVYYMFLYVRKFMNYTQPAIDAFLLEYPRDPINKEKAFRKFADIVGTNEAKNLSEILYQCDQATPDEIKEVLVKQYEELRGKRQQAYKSRMKDRGVIAYTLVFLGVLVVLVSALMVYFLEYQDLMSSTYNMQ